MSVKNGTMSRALSLGGFSSKQLLTAAAAAAVAVLSFGQVNAAVLYLDTNGVTPGTTNSTAQQTWNTGNTNWTTDPTGSIATSAYVAGSDVVFSASDGGANIASGAFPLIVSGSQASNSITFKDGTVTVNPSTTPPTRTIGAGGVTLAATAGGNATFTNANGGLTIVLSASQTWANNHATANLSSANVINSNATAGNTYTLTATTAGTGNVTFSGVIGNGTAGGKTALASSGRLNLLGANTFSGGTTITGGTTTLDTNGALGHTNITITGGTLAAGTTGNGGTLTDNLVADTSELISLSGSGVLDLTNMKFSLVADGAQTLGEYVLANKAVGSSNVIGSAFLSTSLPSGYSINYTGTTANPNSIVLINSNAATPEPAAIGLLGLAAVGGLRRRRSI